MQFDPLVHHRHSIRLPGYDYRQPGAYFITLVTQNRMHIFGKITYGKMLTNECGQIVNAMIGDIPNRFPTVSVDTYVVMPNHIHGIIIIHESVGAGSPRPYAESPRPFTKPPRPYVEIPRPRQTTPSNPAPQCQPPTLGQIMAFYKYQTTVQINQINGTAGLRIWQRNYYEHIIRNENELRCIREYISNNPMKWSWDEDNQ